MKKVSALVITLGLSVVVLAACNNNQQESLMDAQDENQFSRQINVGPNQNQTNVNDDEKRYSGLAFNSTTEDQSSPNTNQNQNRNTIENQNASHNQIGNRTPPNQNQNTNQNQISQNLNAANNNASGSLGDFQTQVVELTNKRRQENGLSPLDADQELTKVAQAKSEDMATNNYFSHTSPTYGSPFDMMNQFGIEYTTAAENIAAGQTTPEEVVKGWMNSEGHKKNIMNEKITHIGVGFSENGNHWTQMFIKK
ncbi:hypothetical protein GH741_01720 [Aquibacillus halophilus]|uniref:SCP domain-containing protein n=1 Tax=Aquibacillus halophilus TaxID=930132 RepID=A0A6A8DC03_9BACI|nr:CAP domain-containing protein [Aquibacillus halophilus]MRH41389.1 hypothetical protein [Aquibacillus halophilus]